MVFVSALPRQQVRTLIEKYDARCIHKPFDATEFEQVAAEAVDPTGEEMDPGAP